MVACPGLQSTGSWGPFFHAVIRAARRQAPKKPVVEDAATDIPDYFRVSSGGGAAFERAVAGRALPRLVPARPCRGCGA